MLESKMVDQLPVAKMSVLCQTRPLGHSLAALLQHLVVVMKVLFSSFPSSAQSAMNLQINMQGQRGARMERWNKRSDRSAHLLSIDWCIDQVKRALCLPGLLRAGSALLAFSAQPR